MDKKHLRKIMLEKRSSLTESICHNYSLEIAESLKTIIRNGNYKVISSFMSFRNEVNTESINKWLLENNYTLVLPLVDMSTKKMTFYVVENTDQLLLSAYGILEPNPELCKPIDNSIIDFVITPGLAFDKQGYRLGYGGGFYDRLFSDLNINTPKVAVAFSVQIIEKIPADPYDQRVNKIVTENSIITI